MVSRVRDTASHFARAAEVIAASSEADVADDFWASMSKLLHARVHQSAGGVGLLIAQLLRMKKQKLHLVRESVSSLSTAGLRAVGGGDDGTRLTKIHCDPGAIRPTEKQSGCLLR